MPKLLVLAAAVAGVATLARKRASGQARSALWREATKDTPRAGSQS
ncbi:MAG TPA: DLW-39 family protein [Jatrophihabitantaceae bacterium]